MASEVRLIDVNKVIDAMQKCIDESDASPDSVAVITFRAIIAALKKEPVVDAEKVTHGHWIEILTGQNSSGYECSECGRIISVVSDVDLRQKVLAKRYPYCHCGAKMDGGAVDGL